MAKKSTKTILSALKKAGITVEDQEKVEAILDDLEFDPTEVAGEDHVVLTTADYRELKDDLKSLRARAKTAEQERDQLKEANEAGDSVNKQKAERLQNRVNELEPMMKELIGAYSETWSAAAGKIPDKLKAKFVFAEEGKELTPQQLMTNIRKMSEYRELGVLDLDQKEEGSDGGTPPTPPAPRVPPKTDAKKLSEAELSGMSPAAKIQAGYKAIGS